MASEWKQYAFGELGKVVTGKTPPTARAGHYGGQIPFITPSDMDGRKIIGSTMRTLSDSGVKAVKSSVVPPCSILVSCIGSDMGKVAMSESESVTNQQINSIVVSNCFCAEFIYYSLLGRKAEFQTLARGGSAQPILNKGTFEKLKLRAPDLDDQRRIASCLAAIDDKIDNLRITSELLETVARAVFKSWFVDFDPVRAKAEGREPEGMDVATAALFSSEFEDSVLGSIPQGWKLGTIFDIASLLSGGTPKTSRDDYWGGTLAWASAKDVSQCRQSFLVKTERTITERGLVESSTKLIPAYSTVVVARGATTGRMALLGRDMAMNQTCYALESRLETPFALHCLVQNLMNQLVHAAHGSVFETITTSTFSGTQILLPPSALLKRCETLIDVLFKRILINTEMMVSLADLRDTLLPRLISGKLRVPEAEKLVEAVV